MNNDNSWPSLSPCLAFSIEQEAQAVKVRTFAIDASIYASIGGTCIPTYETNMPLLGLMGLTVCSLYQLDHLFIKKSPCQ